MRVCREWSAIDIIWIILSVGKVAKKNCDF